MKVLYIHQHFTTRAGAGGTRSYEMARALLAAGHEVTMVCGRHAQGGIELRADRRGWGRGIIDGIHVIALPLPYSNRDSLTRRAATFLRFAWQSIGLALSEDYDLLFATSTPLTAGLPGIVGQGLGGKKPFVFEVRDLWPDLPRALGLKNPLILGGMFLLERLTYRCADACIGLAPGIVQGIRERARPSLPVAMIPNGCDLELFHPRERSALSLPGIVPGDFVAGFTGTMGPANGLDAVVDAARVLKQRGRRGIKLLIVGDGKEKARLVARAAAEGCDNCIFLPPMKKSELAKITASLDCGLMILANVPAFYYGTSPNKFFDYLAAGLPVVVNHPGWISDLIQEHACGEAVASDPAALADALERLADDSDKRRSLGRNARVLAEGVFARETLSRQFVDYLEAVARSRQPSAIL